jgi:hypothetical protein
MLDGVMVEMLENKGRCINWLLIVVSLCIYTRFVFSFLFVVSIIIVTFAFSYTRTMMVFTVL